MSELKIVPTKMGYGIFSGKSSLFLTLLKRHIPACDRAFSGKDKAWYVDPKHRAKLIEIIEQAYGTRLDPPHLNLTSPPSITKEFRVMYLGQCKLRDNNVSSASGTISQPGKFGDWSLVLPEDVLRAFFNQTTTEGQPEAKPSLYATLGLATTALVGDIKSAFRRMARQWHPDVNRDQDAPAMFRGIQSAYEVLSDPLRRRKYDAGLAFEAQTEVKDRWSNFAQFGYFRPPLKCGLIEAEWSAWLGRFTAKKILRWDDIVREDGHIMSSNWPRGAETFQINWVKP